MEWNWKSVTKKYTYLNKLCIGGEMWHSVTQNFMYNWLGLPKQVNCEHCYEIDKNSLLGSLYMRKLTEIKAPGNALLKQRYSLLYIFLKTAVPSE